MKRLFLILILSFCYVFCFSQAQLVKDINTNPSGIQASNNYSSFFFKSDNLAYFPIEDSKGKELWVTDGTIGATKRLIDLNPGRSDGYSGSIFAFQNKTFFGGDNGSIGYELWMTDGTELGTSLVKDIASGSLSSNPSGFFKFGNQLYFSANDNISGWELWRTDGTQLGTQLFFDGTPGSGSTYILDYSPGQSKFYFFSSVYDGISTNFQFWVSDGTPLGTKKIKDFPYFQGTIIPSYLTVVGDIAYFSANDNGAGDKIWRSDGTLLGTYSIEDRYGFSFVPYKGSLLYAANGGFWITNGGIGASQLLFNSYFYGGTEVNNDFYAIGLNSIIKTNGTPVGTQEVAQWGSVTMYEGFPVLNNKIITAYNPVGADFTSQEVGSFDISTGAISFLKEIKPGPSGSQPRSWIVINNKILFLADDGVHGLEIWETDGTTNGTLLFLDTNLGTANANIRSPNVLNDQIYFLASESSDSYPIHLWKTSGEAATTSSYYDFRFPVSLGQLSNDLYYFDDRKLWKTNGLLGGTEAIIDLSSQTNSWGLSDLSYISNRKLFYGFGSYGGTLLTGYEPWVTDGTPSGTHILKDINPGIASSGFGVAIDLNSKLLFPANDGTLGYELWISDGTEAGTVLLKDINNGSLDSNPSYLLKLGSNAIFSATTNLNGNELWKTDGTLTGTALLKDIMDGTGNSNPTNLVMIGSQVFFIASDNTHPLSLWKTDGTEAGTVLVKFIKNGISNLTEINGKLYFSADDGINGRELWISDGTNAGTYMIDILKGSNSSNPFGFFSTGSICYFITADGIWKTGGTDETTILVSDLLPTTKFTSLGDWTYFGAKSIDYGNELFKIKNKNFQTILFDNFSDKKFGDPEFALNASSSSSLPITFQFTEPGIVEFVNGKLKILKPGTVTITANQAGNDNFEPAVVVSRVLNITRGDQLITFPPIANKTLGDAPFSLSATSNSGLPVSLSSTSDKVKIVTNQVELLKAGKVKIDANQAGDSNFNLATTVQVEFCINPSKPTITVNSSNLAEQELSSSSDANNLWFKNDVLLTSVSGKIIKVTESGSYKVKVAVEGCESLFSDSQVLVITGIENEPKLSIFPNPTTDQLTISLPKNFGLATIEIIGVCGDVVYTSNTLDFEKSIDFSSLAVGIYYVRVSNSGKVFVGKIIRQ
jgi:ELWxxDGT repeat protein